MKDSSELMSVKRLAWVDCAKALLICFMCIGHSSAHELLKTCIYTFHMPAFFILSGYLYKPQTFKKRTLSLLIPIIFFGFINCIFECLVDSLKGGSFFSANWIGFYSFFPGFWFLVTLFIIYCLSGDLFKIPQKFHIWISVSTLLLSLLIESVIGFSYFCSNRVLYYLANLITCFPFFSFGVFLKDKTFIKLRNKILLFILIITSITITFLQGRSDLGELLFNYSYGIFFINAIIVSFLFFNLCSLLNTNSVIINLSVGTLVILGIHRIIISTIYILTNRFDLSWIISIIVIIFIGNYLIIYIKDAAPILLGKIKK